MTKPNADGVLELSVGLLRDVLKLESSVESLEPKPEAIYVLRRAELELQMATEKGATFADALRAAKENALYYGGRRLQAVARAW